MSFDLEAFKRGVPAVDRLGKKWFYAGEAYLDMYGFLASEVGGVARCHFMANGNYWHDGEIADEDLIDMVHPGESRMDVIGQNGNDGLHYNEEKMKFIQRTTQITVMPENEAIFSEMATHVKIDDEAAGEFIVVSQNEGSIKFDAEEWPMIKAAIEAMIGNLKE